METEGGSEVEAAIEKAFPAIAEVQPLGKEGDNPLLALSASEQFQIGIGVSASNDREDAESAGGSRFFLSARGGPDPQPTSTATASFIAISLG